MFLHHMVAYADFLSDSLLLAVRIFVAIFFFLWFYHLMACVYFLDG